MSKAFEIRNLWQHTTWFADGLPRHKCWSFPFPRRSERYRRVTKALVKSASRACGWRTQPSPKSASTT